MVVNYGKLPVLQMVGNAKAGWLIVCCVVLAAALAGCYFICHENALPTASESVRDAMRANGLCAADCRRLLLQSIKRAMAGW